MTIALTVRHMGYRGSQVLHASRKIERGVAQVQPQCRQDLVVARTAEMQSAASGTAVLGPARFERDVISEGSLNANDARQFELFVSKTGQSFLEGLDNWLAEKEQERAEEARSEQRPPESGPHLAENAAKIGVGVFLYKHFDGDFSAPSNGEQKSATRNGTAS